MKHTDTPPRAQMRPEDKRFSRRWGTIAILLAALLTLELALIFAGSYESSRASIENFISIEATYEQAKAELDAQSELCALTQAEFDALDARRLQAEDALALANQNYALALEALAQVYPDDVKDVDARISQLDTQLAGAQAELESRAAMLDEARAEANALAAERAELDKQRASAARKARTQYDAALKLYKDKLNALDDGDEIDASEIERLQALIADMQATLDGFDSAVAEAQAESQRVTDALNAPINARISERSALVDEARAGLDAILAERDAALAERQSALTVIAQSDADMQARSEEILALERALETELTALEAARAEDTNADNELTRLRVLYNKADTNKNNIGISRFLAEVERVLTSPALIIPVAVLLAGVCITLIIRLDFFRRARSSYQNVLGDPSKKRVRSAALIICVLAALLLSAILLNVTGEYDAAGVRLDRYKLLASDVSKAELEVSKAQKSISDYEELIDLLDDAGFAGKSALNSKQKSVYNKALKAAGLKESQILPGAPDRDSNVRALQESVYNTSLGEYEELAIANAALDAAKLADDASFGDKLWSNAVRLLASKLLIILYVFELIVFIAVTFMACFKNRVSVSGTVFNVNNYVIVSLCAFITIAPFFYVLGASFATEYELAVRPMFIIPQDFSVDAYRYIMSSNKIIRSMGNSVFITACGTAINLFFTMTMAYVLSKRYLHGRNFFLNMVIVSMFFSGGMIPGYLLVSSWLKLKNTYWSVLLPGAISAYNLMIVKNFFQGLPQELEESARIDGCNEIGTLIRIVLPLSLPVIATFGLFYAVGHWNSYFSAMIYMTGASEKWPLQVILREIIVLSEASAGDLSAMDPNFVEPPQKSIKMAVIVVSTVPIMCVYPFLQKYFVKGVMVGALKG